MIIDYEELEKEITDALSQNKNWVLSTSYIDKISSRNMSIINLGMNIFFQTNKKYTKYQQITKNKNVALCFSNISITGTAEELGSWKDTKNKELMEFYKKIHPSSFEKYGMLDGQVVIKITPNKVALWKYIGEEPVREILHIERKKAERVPY